MSGSRPSDRANPPRVLARMTHQNKRAERGCQAGAGGPLGNNPKSVDNADAQKRRKDVWKQARRQLYAELKTAAFIVGKYIRKEHGITKCRWCSISSQVSLHLTEIRGAEAKKAAVIRGTKICGNVWGCPVCSSRISRHRQGEMNHLLAWAREQGFVPVMLTLTARHGLDDKLADMLMGMKKAKQRLHQRAEWKRLPMVGSVTATEITHGRRFGWHPHFHQIVLLRAKDEAEALRLVKPLARAWRVSLKAFGLSGRSAAFQAQGAAAAGRYISKWGAAEELTLGSEKTGREGKDGTKGRTPRDLLRLSAEGDRQASTLWVEYFRATSIKRRRQLVWSRGLEALCGLKEVSDEEAAEAGAEDASEVAALVEWSNDEWRQVRPKRVRIMEAAESGGGIAAVRLAERGPPDPGMSDPGPLVEDDDMSSLPDVPDQRDQLADKNNGSAKKKQVVKHGEVSGECCVMVDPPEESVHAHSIRRERLLIYVDPDGPLPTPSRTINRMFGPPSPGL